VARRLRTRAFGRRGTGAPSGPAHARTSNLGHVPRAHEETGACAMSIGSRDGPLDHARAARMSDWQRGTGRHAPTGDEYATSRSRTCGLLPYRTLKLTKPSVAALLRVHAAERQSFGRQRHPRDAPSGRKRLTGRNVGGSEPDVLAQVTYLTSSLLLGGTCGKARRFSYAVGTMLDRSFLKGRRKLCGRHMRGR
jgi:hypothetical protein